MHIPTDPHTKSPRTRWPTLFAFLEGREQDEWDWCYRAMMPGIKYTVLETTKGRWYYSQGSNPKFRLACK